MRKLFLCSCILLLVSGCASSSTIFVASDEAPTRYDEINRRAEGREARLVLQDGTTLIVDHLRVTADSTSWGTGECSGIATESIQEIAFRRDPISVAEGTGIGLLAGAVVGGVMGLSKGETCPSFTYGTLCITAGTKAVVWAMGLAPLGGLIGLLVGVSDEREQIYRFFGTAPHFDIGGIAYSLTACDPPRQHCRQFRYYHRNASRGGELIGEPGWDDTNYREAAERAILRYLQLVRE